jgi:hypothetical protein
MMSFGARKIDKKMLTFLEFPCSNTVGTASIYIYVYSRQVLVGLVTIFLNHYLRYIKSNYIL